MYSLAPDTLQVLIAALVLCVAVQGADIRRLLAAFLFVAPVVLHEVFLSDLDGFAYYWSDAGFNLATIVALACISRPSKLIITLQHLGLISLMLNIYGWIAWMSYLQPDVYNLAFIGLYFTAIIILMWGSDGVLGGSKMDRGHPGLSRHAYQRGYTYNHHKETL